MLDQHQRMLLQIAEARRMHGTSDRLGSVHQVYRKDNEQKIRVNIGKRPDGSPWLTPWIKIETHHGALREQQKFHKGQNVKVTAAGADFSQATVTPHGENKAHPEPQHATDDHETSQYAAVRKRSGPDFEERWLATSGQVQGQDPDKISKVLVRWGAKPPDPKDKNQPWDGPDPDKGDAKKRHLVWVGDPGNTPVHNGDAIVTQFDKDAKTEVVKGSILNKVQSADGKAMVSPDSGDGTAHRTTTDHLVDGIVSRIIHDTVNGKITSTVHKNGDITHVVQDMMGNVSKITQQMNQIIHQMQSKDGAFSFILHQAEQIFHQVGSSILQITPSEINLNAGSVNINTGGFSSPSLPPIPDVSSTGDAPLIRIVRLWSIEADLTVDAVLHATARNFRWTVEASAHAAVVLTANLSSP